MICQLYILKDTADAYGQSYLYINPRTVVLPKLFHDTQIRCSVG